MNSIILASDFITKTKQNIESLSIELSKNKIDTKEALEKVKQIRSNVTHIHNLLKLEESLEKER